MLQKLVFRERLLTKGRDNQGKVDGVALLGVDFEDIGLK